MSASAPTVWSSRTSNQYGSSFTCGEHYVRPDFRKSARRLLPMALFDSRVLERCGACLLRLHIYPLTALRLWEPAIRRGHE